MICYSMTKSAKAALFRFGKGRGPCFGPDYTAPSTAAGAFRAVSRAESMAAPGFGPLAEFSREHLHRHGRLFHFKHSMPHGLQDPLYAEACTTRITSKCSSKSLCGSSVDVRTMNLNLA